MEPREIDIENTDVLAADELVYEPDGRTLLARLAEQGYDTSNLGELADQFQREGKKIPKLPPLTDRP